MKKWLVVVVVLFLLGSLVVFLKRKVGDVRPALLPAPKQKQQVATDRELDFPLKLPQGFQIKVFADGLGAPRDLEISSKGTLLVSVPKEGEVVALVAKGTGAEAKTILSGLDSPHGVSFYKDKLYVAEETRVARYNFDEDKITATLDKVLFELPAGGNHITRSLDFNEKGQMFVSIGSTCDVCFEKHPWLAATVVSDSEGREPRLLSSGLRNAVFIKTHPETQKVWATEMGRDFLGDETPPDEINILQKGHYGWPVCYGNRVYDREFGQRTPQFCENTIPTAFEIPAHSAPLGLNFIYSKQFPDDWQGDLLVAYHGSWNRSVPTGYKIVRMNVEGEKVTGAQDFITGFLQGSTALGRPVDLEFDSQGNLYISDDKAGVVYRVTKL